MSGFYIGRRTVQQTVRRTELWDVWADSPEDAAAKFAAGGGKCYAFLENEILEDVVLQDFYDIKYDEHEGMGR